MVLTFLLKKDPVWETLFKPLLSRWHLLKISHKMLAGAPTPGALRALWAVSAWPAQWLHWVGQVQRWGVHSPSHQRHWKAKLESCDSGGQGRGARSLRAGPWGAICSEQPWKSRVVVERPWRAHASPQKAQDGRFWHLEWPHQGWPPWNAALPVEGRGQAPCPTRSTGPAKVKSGAAAGCLFLGPGQEAAGGKCVS